MGKFLRDNGLTIVLMLLFFGSLLGHWLAGAQFHNEELASHGQPRISPVAFLGDPLFLATLFENWESEFLQMGAYVVLTAMLFQRGSAESADPDKPPRDASLPTKSHKADAPSPLRMGWMSRWLYAHSLGLALFILFAASFVLHWLFSAKAAAAEAAEHGDEAQPLFDYLFSAQMWFESFQNWQSEFLSTAVLIVLSIWLRQRDSPESKAVTAQHGQTGTKKRGAARRPFSIPGQLPVTDGLARRCSIRPNDCPYRSRCPCWTVCQACCRRQGTHPTTRSRWIR